MAKMRNRNITSLIFEVRQQRVILDADLARIYGTSTKALNQAVKRNRKRFPEDFAFQLGVKESEMLRSQIVTSNPEQPVSRGGRRYRPWMFTEHGALMAATILNSAQAVRMSVYVVRTFVLMREQIAANAAILKRLVEINKTLLEHDQALGAIWRKLQPLLQPSPDPPRREIGFHVREQAALYRKKRSR